MSDFEYEVNDNDISDNDNDGDNISYDFDYESSKDSVDSEDSEAKTNTIKTNTIIIDMDDEVIAKDMKNKLEILAKPKLKLKTKEKSKDESNNEKDASNTFNSIFTSETKIEKIEPKQQDSKKITKKDEKKDPDSNSKQIKLTKKEQGFEYNQENIEFFTKDLDFKKILIKNSPFTNDIEVICLLLKHKLITEYCCSVKKCKVKTLWMDKPIQLILHRKNNIQTDLSSYNLELICANCYLSIYGLEIFKKKEKEIIFKCNICNFPLVQFNNNRKKKGTCLACEKKMSNIFTKNIESEYYDKVEALYNDNPLLSEENKYNNSNYYNHKNGTKFKPRVPSTKVQAQSSSVGKPVVISLNMTIPNMDDLIEK
jgi:hypothetical protein